MQEKRVIVLQNQTIQVTEYQEGDREEILNFLKGIAIAEFGFEDWQDYFNTMSFKPYQKPESKFWLLRREDTKIIGTIGALSVSKSEVKLNSLYLAKEYRKQGIARLLYQIFMKFVQEQGYMLITLHTYHKFTDAIAFYEKNGFILEEEDDEGKFFKKRIENTDKKIR